MNGISTGSIFGNGPRPIRRFVPATVSLDPRGSQPAPAAAARPIAPSTSHSPHDATLIAILDAPLQPGETAHAGFSRKEAELGTAFAALSVANSRALHGRLSNPKAGDEVATKFSRLTIERRSRLINFLADARRREAMTQGRR